jgi:DNA-binding winged helix-turn-helix (wHTH) protein
VYYSFGHFQVDPYRRALWRDGKVVPLAPKAFEMLLLLVENQGRVLEKQELMDHLWPGSVVEEANLSQTVYLLRRALAEGSDERQYIETIPKRGYRFVAKIVELGENAEEIAQQPANEESNENRKPPGVVNSRSTRRRTVLLAGGVALLAVIVTAALYLWPSRQPARTDMVRSLAVLPFWVARW